MASQDDPGIRTEPKRCRNNGILEYWNDGTFLKTQYSNIPTFQASEGPVVRKPFIYNNSCPSGKSFLDKSDER